MKEIIKKKLAATMYVDMYYDSLFHIDSSYSGLQETRNNLQMEVEKKAFAEDILKHSLTVIFFAVATLEATLFYYGRDLKKSEKISTFNRWIRIVQLKTNKSNPINKELEGKIKTLIKLRNKIVHLEPINGRIELIDNIEFVEFLKGEAVMALKTVEDFLLEIQSNDPEDTAIKEVLERIQYWNSYVKII